MYQAQGCSAGVILPPYIAADPWQRVTRAQGYLVQAEMIISQLTWLHASCPRSQVAAQPSSVVLFLAWRLLLLLFGLISSKKTGRSWAGRDFGKARKTVQGSFNNNIAHCNLWSLGKPLLASSISIENLLSCSAASHKLSLSEVPAPLSAPRMPSMREIAECVT